MADDAKHVDALWVGPFEALTVDGVHLVPGETVYSAITEGEAEASSNWLYPVPAKAKAKSKDGD